MQKIIDCHCHIYPDKIAARAAEAIGAFYGIEIDHDGTLATLLRVSDEAGVDHTVVCSVATTPEQVSGINRYLSKTVSENSSRLAGIGTLHPASTHLQEDFNQLCQLGLLGVKLHPDFQKFALDDPLCMNIYELCQQKNMPILLHTGDKRYDFSNPDRLNHILAAFPHVRFIGAHLGGWSVWDQASQQLRRHDNLYVDTSSALYALKPERAAQMIRHYGADRVLFGTDYPMWTPSDELKRFEALNLTCVEQESILYQNAIDLFGLPF